MKKLKTITDLKDGVYYNAEEEIIYVFYNHVEDQLIEIDSAIFALLACGLNDYTYLGEL